MPARRFPSDTAVAAGLALGGLGPILVGGVLVPWRDQIGQVNIALILVVIVVAAAAVGGHAGGIVGALVAALSFNFWYTMPYETLRVANSRDVEHIVLLFIVGLIVGELALVRERLRADVQQRQVLLDGLVHLSDLIARGAPVKVVWSEARSALQEGLSAEDVRYERFGTEAPPLPRITIASPVPRAAQRVFRFKGFELPRQGAEIVVQHRGDMLGRLVILPTAPVGVSVVERRVAVAIADLLASSLAGAGDVELD